MRKRTISVKNISKISDTAGVYFLINQKGETFYIGKSTNIRERLKSHLSPKKRSFGDFAKETARVAWVPTSGEIEALILEASAIKKYRPKYNILLTDDKKYFYVEFANIKNPLLGAELPYLMITHRPQRLPGTIYVGAFTEGRALKTLLRYLRKAFPYYTSARHSRLPCAYCHLDLCPGPEADLVQYKKNIRLIQKILEGKRPSVERQLAKDMKQYATKLDFERAQKIRETLDALRNIFAHRQFLGRESVKKPDANDSASILARVLGSDKPINTIEGYDISNIQGREPVASMVRFSDGKPDKTLYRKFKIRLPEKPDDFAMMHEVISRRLAHPEWPYPQLFLIDGGKGQLSAALKAIQKSKIKNQNDNLKFKIVALAKQENELFLPGKSMPILLKTLPTPVQNLLLHVRDEAHRFAIAYHRKLHRRTFEN